jgi:hypothetical protein
MAISCGATFAGDGRNQRLRSIRINSLQLIWFTARV